MKKNLFTLVCTLAIAALMLGACATPTTEAPKPTSAPAATTAPAQPTAAPKPTEVKVTNPPTTPEMVDAIVLEGKKVEVIYWHNRPEADQKLLQGMLDEFNKSNPYGVTAKAEIAGAGYPDVYNKVNAALQAGQPPDLSVAYQNQAAFYRAQGAVVDINPFLKSKKYGLSEADQKRLLPNIPRRRRQPAIQGRATRFSDPTLHGRDVSQRGLVKGTRL